MTTKEPRKFYLPDGSWCCTDPNPRTEPCGDCGGCRYVAAVNQTGDWSLPTFGEGEGPVWNRNLASDHPNPM